MKLLILGGTKHPHIFSDKHTKQIKRAHPGTEITTVTNPKAGIKYLSDVDIVTGFPALVAALPLKEAHHLKWVHSFSAGVDRLAGPGLLKKSVLLSNSSGIHATPIAEHIIGFILMTTRNFPETFRNQQKRVWKKLNTVTELRDKIVLIVGLGKIGTEAARLVTAFRANVIAVNRTKGPKPKFVDRLITPEQMDRILPKADFVVSCLPLTKTTRNFFNMKRLRLMKPSATIINIGRGGIINERDLVTALKKKIIASAALDVTEIEPLPSSSPLWRMKNVIITPHHSGLSEKYIDRAIDQFCRNLKAFTTGKALPNLVDKTLGY